MVHLFFPKALWAPLSPWPASMASQLHGLTEPRTKRTGKQSCDTWPSRAQRPATFVQVNILCVGFWCVLLLLRLCVPTWLAPATVARWQVPWPPPPVLPRPGLLPAAGEAAASTCPSSCCQRLTDPLQ